MFDLELGKVVSAIQERGSKQVLIQLPDGLKPKAKEIADHIEQQTSASVFIWFSSCYGACDMPHVQGIDLLIQWGHTRFQKESW